MLDEIIHNEILWVFILVIYGMFIVFSTRKIYDWAIKKGYKKKVIIYYNRKLIHIFAGGVIVLAVPFVFPNNPWYPLLAGLVLTVATLMLHRSGRILYWFQTEDNINDVSFCFMWAVAIFILWQIFGNMWIAIIPPAFIAFGDGITGIVRNLAFQERKKHPIGNIYMMGVCIPIGYYFSNMSGIEGLALWGVIAAIVASLFERYEFGLIDDNILVTVSAAIILYVGGLVGPLF